MLLLRLEKKERTWMQSRNKRYVLLSLMIAFSLVLRVVEGFLPATAFIAPGLKLGLANIITVVMLYRFRPSETFLVTIVRVILGSVLGGGLSSFLYSAAGAVLSFFVMLLFRGLRRFPLSIIGVSILGAVFFNVGQLSVASWIIGSKGIFVYLPIMGLLSIVTGLFVGLVSKRIIENKVLWKNLI